MIVSILISCSFQLCALILFYFCSFLISHVPMHRVFFLRSWYQDPFWGTSKITPTHNIHHIHLYCAPPFADDEMHTTFDDCRISSNGQATIPLEFKHESLHLHIAVGFLRAIAKTDVISRGVLSYYCCLGSVPLSAFFFSRQYNIFKNINNKSQFNIASPHTNPLLSQFREFCIIDQCWSHHHQHALASSVYLYI
jgi:hypothetical protein